MVLLLRLVLLLITFKNLLSLSKDSFRHWMRQNPCLAASLAASTSSMKASSSCFGESAPQGPPPLRLSGPCGHADCHRSARVEIIGGRTGLFSRIRSSSSMTLEESRGSSCNGRSGVRQTGSSKEKIFWHQITEDPIN